MQHFFVEKMKIFFFFACLLFACFCDIRACNMRQYQRFTI